MTIQLTDSAEVEVVENKGFNYFPRWYLQDQIIWLGNFKTGIELEKLTSKTIGSADWLWGDSDTIRFLKEDLHLYALAISIPSSIEIDNSVGENLKNIKIRKGNLKLKEDKNFSLSTTSFAYYSFPNDILILLTDPLGQLEDCELVELTKDFFIIVRNSQFKGWILKNSSLYISSSDQTYLDIKSGNEVKNFLYEFLKLCNDKSYEDMEDGSEIIKSQLIELKGNILRDITKTNNVLIEAIDNLLETFYS